MVKNSPEGMVILNSLYDLKPGEKATIVVEVMSKSNDGIKAAITCLDPIGKQCKEGYFKVLGITKGKSIKLNNSETII